MEFGSLSQGVVTPRVESDAVETREHNKQLDKVTMTKEKKKKGKYQRSLVNQAARTTVGARAPSCLSSLKCATVASAQQIKRKLIVYVTNNE